MTPARACLQLTKPGITLFIGVSAAAGYVAAREGGSQPGGLVVMLLATMAMSGGAAALNHVAERDSDARMRRTSRRPLPSGDLTAAQAALFGWGLSAAGLLLSLLALPPLATLFLVLSHVSYVYLYTPLKRRSQFCTLAGALPGALPVLAGWCATGVPLNLTALALTSVLYMWQIPHFLAIGWLAREDYGRAGCPMLGVLDPTGVRSARVSLVYAGGMLFCSLLVAAASPASWLFAVVASATGAWYIAAAWKFVIQPQVQRARSLFLTSLAVLPVLLTALVTDLLIG